MKNKNSKQNQKVSKVSILLYVLAVVMFVVALYNVYTCYQYVTSIVEQGFVVSESLEDVINYYLSNVSPYAFYAICLWGLGYMIQKVTYLVDHIQLSLVANGEEEIITEVKAVEVDEVVEEETETLETEVVTEDVLVG